MVESYMQQTQSSWRNYFLPFAMQSLICLLQKAVTGPFQNISVSRVIVDDFSIQYTIPFLQSWM